MRLSLRFLIPLLLALGVFAYAAVPLVDGLMLRWFVRDLDIRASLLANAVQDPLVTLVEQGSPGRITRYFARLLQDERMHGVGLCVPGVERPISSPDFPEALGCDALGA